MLSLSQSSQTKSPRPFCLKFREETIYQKWKRIKLCKSMAPDEMYLGTLRKLIDVTVALSVVFKMSFN